MRSLKTQLSLAIAAVVLVTVALISFLSNVLLNREFETYIAAQQERETAEITDNLVHQYNTLTGTWSSDALHSIGMFALYDGYILKVDDVLGETVWDAENHDTALCKQVMDSISEQMKQHGSSGEFISRDFPLMLDEQTIGTASVSFYGPYFMSESDFAFLDALNFVLIAVGTFSLLLSLAAGRLLAKRVTHPITRTADIAGQISAGNYAIQFEGETKTRELFDLVTAVNHLAAALETQENLRKQLTADVSHELRTPIATLSSHLEAMLEGLWEPTPERLQSCHEEILRLGTIVADLERLEQLDGGSPSLNKVNVDLLRLAKTVCANFESELAVKKLSLEIEGEPTPISLDRDRIAGVFTNLISNAVKYTPGNGRINIFVSDSADAGTFVIEDSGSGVSEAELPLIFERFYRADKSRGRDTGGAGIGLAIAKSTVTAHGGTIIAENVSPHGCRFVVTLPK